MIIETSVAIPVLIGTVLLVSGCGSAPRGESIVGPLSVSDASVQRGRVLYDQHCYKCHGEGEGALAPALNDKPLPKCLIRLQVRHGLGVMPPMSDQEIDDQQLQDIVNYVVALRNRS